MKNLVILFALFGLTACSSATKAVNSDATTAKVRLDTATYFATSQRNVAVGNFEQTIFGTAYKSKVAGTVYDCNYFRGAVTCSRAI